MMKKFQVVLILHKNCVQKAAIQSSHLPAIGFFVFLQNGMYTETPNWQSK